ncbi:LOW QUALITY PROTEIN: sodium-coupled monocarboxylate transporter 1-like [Dromiciops gliroides]|uniref:LOW QUALITY PROTEIN: sodium-coupled monocarboxylate transporter 1-like n=1 Tax=Dromiciops gliroides TaxID=33562 RepID=UPI001CC5798E|nr:LOW QUALITY PROTEIN: sodium-coupled monocarboxylate transporter 1-like [Dromiciops gliroides]
MSIHQETGTFGVWDYLVFAGMLFISAAIGIYYAFSRGGRQTPKEFMVGDRQMTAMPVALSLTASFISAITVLGTPSEVYRFGAIFSMYAISQVLVVLITAEVFLPVFYKLGIASTYEYLELRFNKHIRLCGTILFIFQTILYTGIVIYAPALALNQVTGFDLWGTIIVTGVVCTFYCTMGGFKAVIWTDVFQIGIMVAGLFSVIIRAAEIQGGINNILNDSYHGGRLNFWDFNPNPLQRYSFWTIVIGGTFTSTSVYGTSQSQVQRYIACKSRFQAKMSLYISLVGHWIILICTILCGLVIYSRYHDCDPWTSKKVSAPDQLMPYLVMDILQDYPGLPGLFVACVYGGTLSTVSSSINALALVTIEDLIKPHFQSLSEKTLSWFLKGTSVLYGALCIGMAALTSLVGVLLQAALSIFGITGGPLLGLFSLGILTTFVNSMGAFVGLTAGFVISLWIGIGAQHYPPLPERTLPLSLNTYGCNITDFHHQANWNSTTETPFSTSPFQVHSAERTPLMDNWYSLSFMHFSTIGTLVTLLVGIIVSLLTGGRKQSLDDRLLLTKEDFLSNFDFLKREELILNPQSYKKEDGGIDNCAFSCVEMHSTDESGKISGPY